MALPEDLQPRTCKRPVELKQSPTRAAAVGFRQWSKTPLDVGEAAASLDGHATRLLWSALVLRTPYIALYIHDCRTTLVALLY